MNEPSRLAGSGPTPNDQHHLDGHIDTEELDNTPRRAAKARLNP